MEGASEDFSLQEAARKAAAENEERRLREVAAAEAAALAAAEERAALQKQRHMFVIRADGRVAASKARPGMVTDGQVTLPATVEMAAEVGNVLVGELGPVTRGAATSDEAQVPYCHTHVKMYVCSYIHRHHGPFGPNASSCISRCRHASGSLR